MTDIEKIKSFVEEIGYDEKCGCSECMAVMYLEELVGDLSKESMANWSGDGVLPPAGVKCKYLIKDEIDDIDDAEDDQWTECEVKYSYVNEHYKSHSFIVAECHLYGRTIQQALVLQDTYFEVI